MSVKNKHFKCHFQSIIDITLASCRDGQEKLIEIDRSVIVRIEGGKCVFAERIGFSVRVELLVDVDEFLLIQFTSWTIT